jgi:hypothetical protein
MSFRARGLCAMSSGLPKQARYGRQGVQAERDISVPKGPAVAGGRGEGHDPPAWTLTRGRSELLGDEPHAPVVAVLAPALRMANQPICAPKGVGPQAPRTFLLQKGNF